MAVWESMRVSRWLTLIFHEGIPISVSNFINIIHNLKTIVTSKSYTYA